MAFLFVLDFAICILQRKEPSNAFIFQLIYYLYLRISYRNSSYRRETGKTFDEVIGDTGSWGEYLTYHKLRSLEKCGGKFLFNAYIPREGGGTTEIDLMLICRDGVFVFESKNYSGWIFGSESRKTWYVTLPAGRKKSRKETFYNPIFQNRSHIENLRKIIGDRVSIFSVIVFSERCNLKKLDITQGDAVVIKRNNVLQTVKRICSEAESGHLTDSETEALYSQLYSYTKADNETKARHITDVATGYSSYGSDSADTADTVMSNILSDSQSITENTDAALQISTEAAESVPAGQVSCAAAPESGNDPESAIPIPNICPKCGRELVLRRASRGARAGKDFYGCSGFPECRYILNIDTESENNK